MPLDDDSLQRIEALEKRVAQLEQELAAAQAIGRRGAVQQALMDERLLTLERNRLFRLWGKLYRAAANVYARAGSGKRYGGLADLRFAGDYALLVDREQQQMAAADHRGQAAQWRSRPLISVWLTGSEGVADSVHSLLTQCYGNWRLHLPAASRYVVEHIDEPERIRIVENAEPAAAPGELLLRLQAGDRLSPHALHFYAQALQDEAVLVAYADEDAMDRHGHRSAPLFKPAWSPELWRGTGYTGRALVWRQGFQLSEKVADSEVRHIPRVLHHRAAPAEVAYRRPSHQAGAATRLSIIVCSRQIRQVRECLQAIRGTSSIDHELLVVHHLGPENGDEMRQQVEQLGGKWIAYRGPFDFARMNNLGAQAAGAACLLFLNDDVIVGERGWDQGIGAALAGPETGITGAILQYPNGTIQHAGVVTGMGDAAGHCGRFQRSSELWPWLRMGREVSAVTGAMLGIRTQLFGEMGGFDETFPVNYNDVDLCLRVRQAGLRVVCLDLGKVIHRESQTRVGGTRHEEREHLYRKWPEILARPDKFYSVHLAPSERISLKTDDHPLRNLL